MDIRQQSLSRRAVRAVGLGVLFCLAAAAENSTIFTFTTAANATDGQGDPVAAQVVIDVSSNHIHVVLTNLLNNPTSIAQTLSSLFFQVGSSTTVGTLSGSSALGRDIHSDGTYQDMGVAATGWNLSSSGNWLGLCDTGCGAPGSSNALIGGPGANGSYASNSSLTGTHQYNPFLVGNAVFDLAVTGVTYQSTIQNVTFGFGTPGIYVGAGTHTVATVPEPAAIILLASCIVAIAAISRRKRITPATSS